MPAIAIAEPGPAEVLTIVERPVPRPAAGEVLIEVEAAGVNRPDLLQRQGKYPPPPGASDLPGLEVAGTVVALAPDVERWRVGDRVCALLAGGGYAGFAAAPAGQCLPIPSGLDALAADPHLAKGLNVLKGEITHPAVAQALGKASVDPYGAWK